MEHLFETRNLRVAFDTLDGEALAVKGANIHVAPGETVAIVGESGSGKARP
ncbi:MAG: hypothetical protein HC855_04450 [Rhizobiales bacterium]|nr:hypothetical protein [Hyphomicrobiales bacterium]